MSYCEYLKSYILQLYNVINIKCNTSKRVLKDNRLEYDIQGSIINRNNLINKISKKPIQKKKIEI